MKILLAAINAKYIHSNLAVYSLSTYARHKDIKVTLNTYGHLYPSEQKKIADCFVSPLSYGILWFKRFINLS